LMSYGVNFPAMYRRGADYVVKIFKGAKAEDLPVEQAAKFELVVNLNTAKAIGIEFPAGILARADEVIECSRVHHATRRRGSGCVAARGARAAAGDAGGRYPQRRSARSDAPADRRVLGRPQGVRLC